MAITNFGKLLLLMEKNFLLQWRHKIRTVIYILLPVLIAALIVLLRYNVSPIWTQAFNPTSFPVLDMRSTAVRANNNQWTIAYSPNTPFLAGVVQGAVDHLMEYNNAFDEFAESNLTLSIAPYVNSAALDSIYLHPEYVNSIFAAIQFDDSLIGQTVLPSNVEVSLRFPMRPRQGSEATWRTDLSFPLSFSTGPRGLIPTGAPPGYMTEGFLALQHAVSMSIIETKGELDELIDELAINMQRFPHPQYFDDPFVMILPMMLLMLFLIGFSFQAVNIVRSIVEEKEKKLKEAMKIMGLSTWHHWTAWFLNQYFLVIISTLLLVILFKIPIISKTDNNGAFVESGAFLDSIDTSLLTVFLLIYMAALCTFACMMSTFFDGESRVSTVSQLVWLLTFIPSMVLTLPGSAPSTGMQILISFSLNSALSSGFFQMSTYSANSMVLTWSNMFSPLTMHNSFTFGHVMAMLLLVTILQMLIALYVEKVFPGEYGVPHLWYFLFTREYWGLSNHNKVNMTPGFAKSEGLISENEPVGMNVGVNIINLTKVYNDEKVVDNINLKMFEDQITVILGHNGAGKSTTFSMMTGMIPPTSGTAILGGYDISTETRSARASVGLCPQHDILFSGLTVEEHIRFYSRLKGLSGSEVEEETERFIQLLNLVDKKNNLPSALSGGQKRRLSVGIALCGKSKLVFLDEPSSGLDPSARRGLWDILEKEKIGRTVIMTTHFMDEAEILGDRVGIMSAGRVKCIGSPFFLKQQYQLGYTLSIVKDAHCNKVGITRLLERYIPGLKPPTDIGSELSYMLPHGSSNQFEPLLRELEINQAALGYHSYGLTASALEEVFLKVGADERSATVDVEQNENNESYSNYTVGGYTVVGKDLIVNHIRATLLKRLWTTRRAWLQSIIHIAVPFIIILSTLFINTNFSISQVASLDARTLSLENGFIRTNTLMTSAFSLSQSQQAIMEAYKSYFGERDDTTLTDWGNVGMGTTYLREVPGNMRAMRFENMVGVSFHTNSIVAWFSSFSYHDESIALALLDNAILRSVSPSSSLTIINHPIMVAEDEPEITGPAAASDTFQAFINTMYAVSFASSFFIMVYIKERDSRAKLLQKASGLSSAVMWGCAFIHDYIMYIIISLLIIIALIAAQTPGYSAFADIGRSYLVLLVYGAAALPLVYLMAYLFTSPSKGFMILFFINLIMGIMFIVLQNLHVFATIENINSIVDGLEVILYIFPFYSYVAAIQNMETIYLSNAHCRAMCNIEPLITECTAANLRELDYAVTCLEDIPYLGWGNPGISRPLTYMIISGIILCALLMVTEYRLIPTARCFNPKPVERPHRFIDDDVEMEKQRVETILQSPNQVFKLISSALKKQYKNHVAVNGVSFAMNKGECFGLLGINGAGKTSTFKMLTGDLQITAGQAWVDGYSVNNDIKNVYTRIGYCPQFDALFESLTGRENLTIYCWLKGIPLPSTRFIIEDISKKLGFHRYLDKASSTYSGGNKRKLSTAIALLGDAPVIFLDEPTTGMDPAAKRQLWEVILEQVNVGRSVVLTSHSMEECQALCSRLTVMVDGEFRCLGSPQHLKNKFSQGCTITIQRAQNDSILRNGSDQQLAELQGYLRSNFGHLDIKEIAQDLFSYNIQSRSVQWSKLFGILERAKEKKIIEDYSISQTTLEQVFLNFTNK